MQGVPEEFTRRIDALRAENLSGATALLGDAIAILSAARAAGADMRPIAEAICLAQPSMAPVWNATRAALSAVTREM